MTQAVRWIPFAVLVVLGSYSSPAIAEMSCTDCHDVLEKEYLHEAAVMDCTTCHYEHELDTAPSKKLRAPVTELCLSCHQETIMRLDGGHMIQGHPYWIERDPMWDTGDPRDPVPEFNCTTCHNPHASDMPTLFRWDYKKKPFEGNVCAICHKDIAYGGYVPPKPGYDSPRLPPKGSMFGGGRSRTPPEPPKKRRWWEYIISFDENLGRY